MPEFSKYSPTASQPYQPYTPPDIAPQPPPPVAQSTPPFQFTGRPITPVGAVAGVLDNIFRGYMRGREEGDVRKIMQMKAKTDNLRNSYNQDAQTLYSMAQAGVDRNSPEFKQALSAVQGSWGALQDWVGQHVNEGAPKKGKKANSQLSDPLADLKSDDPATKAKAMHQIQQKLGPPVLYQLGQFYTPEATAQRNAAQTMAKAGEVGAQNVLDRETAQRTYDQLKGLPEDKLTDAQRTQLSQAESILFPPKETGAKEMYKLTNGTYDWFYPGTQPEGASAVPHGATRQYEGPGGNRDWFVPGTQPPDWTPVEAENTGGPKIGTFGAYLKTKYGEHPTAEQMAKARREWAELGHFDRSGSGGGAGSTDKNYQKWYAYYKEHYPELGSDQWDALTRRKVEGTSQISAGEIAHDAITEPKQFDNDVLSLAIDNMRRLPKYSGQNPQIANLDDVLANLVGQGDYGYQYHPSGWLKQEGHGPDSHGKYSGNVNDEQLQEVERDLQNQIRSVLSGSKVQGMSPQERRTVLSRMTPLFGPAAGRGNPPASPRAQAAAAPAPVSSQAPGEAILAKYGMNPEAEPPQESFARNKQWAKSGPYKTVLTPAEERQFQQWVRTNRVPWRDTPDSDYDMRGFWKAVKEDKASESRNKWDGRMHFPDTWKTPYDATFSRQSMYAKPNAPRWDGDKLYTDSGQLIADETPKKAAKNPSKGTVRKSAFLKANPGAKDADWNEVKPQLKNQGYDVVDN